MRSASRQALDAVREYETTVFEGRVSAASLAELASELYAVADLFTSQPRLRRTIGDPATSPDARAEAQRIIEDLRAQAQEESARIVQRGEDQLTAQRSQLVRELRGEIGTLAVELSEKIVGQRLADDAAIRGTVDAFLADIERQAASES